MIGTVIAGVILAHVIEILGIGLLVFICELFG